VTGHARERTGAADLVGRADAIARTDELLAALRTGRGTGLVVEGIAGIGKTSLLRHVAARATTFEIDVRWVTGVPVERDLPYAGLARLLGSDVRDAALATQAPALAAAVAFGPSSAPPHVLEVSTDALEVLSGAGRRRGVLLVVDDAQWLDASSLAVVGHIARHAVADGVGVLAARRSDDTAHVDEPHDADGPGPALRSLGGLPVISLGPLTDDDATAMLVVGGMQPEAAARMASRCGGVPLALAELSRGASDGSVDLDAVASRLPVGHRRRVAALSPAASRAALLVAVCTDLTLLRSLDEPRLAEGLRDAEAEGLITLGATTNGTAVQVGFAHPLLRAAVLASASPIDERAAHRVVADACVAAGSMDLAALHLAAAADGPDAEAAGALAALGDRAHARGALSEAARAWSRAAALTPDAAQRAPLLTRAADALFDSGDAASGFASVNAAIDAAVDLASEADARVLRASMATWLVSPRAAVRDLADVATAMAPVDPRRAAGALASAAGASYLDGDIGLGLVRGREALRLAEASGDAVMIAAAGGALGWVAFLAGDAEEAERRAGGLEPLAWALLGQRSWAGIHLAQMLGTMWVCTERWDDADALIRELLRTTRLVGARLTEASTALLLASLSWRRGRWQEARALAEPLLDDIDDIPPVTLAWMRIQIAQLLASTGDIERTRALLDAAVPVIAGADVPILLAVANAVQGHLELSLGDAEVALARLDEATSTAERVGFREPAWCPWLGDHLDALVSTGRRDEAAARCDELKEAAQSRRWLAGVIARTRGRLALDPDEADGHFADALAMLDGLGAPFEVGRTLLARDAPGDRADARRLFLRLGAVVWADRARTPTTVADGDPGTSTPSLLDRLTPQERRVALAVVSGRTNREVGAELHLSAKTIDHYLQHAFRRLGVKNRTELATVVAHALAAPGSQRDQEISRIARGLRSG
jgi:DNA-binding CsgD family transcriptional regulator/tetratricopeptide (TPR) repeat protein